MSNRESWKKIAGSAKELAYMATFTALLIASQLVLSAIPGVELVTVLCVAYAYVFGFRRGMVVATVFSVLRQLVFGFFPVVLILYLVYFNLLTFLFGKLGERKKWKLFWVVLFACGCTLFFHVFDNILTPVWYGYTWEVTKKYVLVSAPVMISQTVCTAVSVSVLFLPLTKIFTRLKGNVSKRR